MPIDGPLMAIDRPHGTAMAIDELRWDLSTRRQEAMKAMKVNVQKVKKTRKVLKFNQFWDSLNL